MKTSKFGLQACAFGALLAASTQLATAVVSFSAADAGGRSATADFDVSGSNLIVTLRNTSSMDVLAPNQVLTCVFFEYAGSALSLTPVSALLDSGAVVHFGPSNGGNVGGEWQYLAGISWPEGNGYGISSVGLNIFSHPNFNGPNLQGPLGLDGLQYGITSAGDNPAVGNAAVTGGFALIQHGVVFTLSGLPANFDPNLIENVWFQYGTDLSEPRTPTPGSLALLGIGLGLVCRRNR